MLNSVRLKAEHSESEASDQGHEARDEMHQPPHLGYLLRCYV